MPTDVLRFVHLKTFIKFSNKVILVIRIFININTKLRKKAENEMWSLIKKTFFSFYMQYELVTCIYMFEPWEKKLISMFFVNKKYKLMYKKFIKQSIINKISDGFVVLICALVVFSSYVYLPSYIQTFLQFVTPLPLQQEKTAAPSYATPILQTDKISIS